MGEAEQALTDRIKQLRRRHFGPGGKARFAQLLNVPLAEYERFERGTLPPGDAMVRMCEATGEDLQWLLTGVAARGTVVISGTRGRHQELLGRLATLLDEKPAAAGALEAFVDLLARGEHLRHQARVALPIPVRSELIPILDTSELPEALPGPDGASGGLPLATLAGAEKVTERLVADFREPSEPEERAGRPVDIITLRSADGREQRFVHSVELARCFPSMFGVRVADDSMEPMLRAGDTVLVAPEADAKLGQPALCKIAGEPSPRCRVWLGEDAEAIRLGRANDAVEERVERGGVLWSLEVLYCLRPAA